MSRELIERTEVMLQELGPIAVGGELARTDMLQSAGTAEGLGKWSPDAVSFSLNVLVDVSSGGKIELRHSG